MADHRAKIDAASRTGQPASAVTKTTVRVNYSETDQMGVVYHARYAVWLDVARTEYLRARGMTYRELEAEGYRLAVAALHIEFRRPARYDDQLCIHCWVTELASRRVTFAYEVRHAESDRLLARAETPMMVLDAGWRPTCLPERVARILRPQGSDTA